MFGLPELWRKPSQDRGSCGSTTNRMSARTGKKPAVSACRIRSCSSKSSIGSSWGCARAKTASSLAAIGPMSPSSKPRNSRRRSSIPKLLIGSKIERRPPGRRTLKNSANARGLSRTSEDEVAAVRDPELAGDRAALGEQRLGDVREDDAPRTSLERAERDEPVAAPDVEQRLAGGEGRVVEDAVAHLGEMRDGAGLEVRIAAGAPAAQPRCPPVLGHLWHRSAALLLNRERAQDLLVLREPPGLVLREDGHAVANHVELTLAAGDVRRGDVIRP